MLIYIFPGSLPDVSLSSLTTKKERFELLTIFTTSTQLRINEKSSATRILHQVTPRIISLIIASTYFIVIRSNALKKMMKF